MARAQRSTTGRTLRRPLATLVLAGVLAADAAWVAGPPGPGTSRGGELVWWAVKRWGMSEAERAFVWEVGHFGVSRFVLTWPTPPPSLFVLRGVESAEPLQLIDQDAESWDTLSAVLAATPRRLAAVHTSHGVWRAGIWALTRERRVDAVQLEPMERGAFDDIDPGRIRALLVAHGYQGAADGPADQTASRVLWWGYMHNLVSLAALAAFVWSLGWVNDVPQRVRRWRAARRLERGVCPGCAYPLGGLEEGVCPECGAVVAEWEPGARPQRRG